MLRESSGEYRLDTSVIVFSRNFSFIQGRIRIKSGSGHVIGDRRFTGVALDVTTDSGDIRVASSYAEHAKFSTNTGSMHLRNLHNESYVAVYESGSVTAQGVDGAANIFVKKVR